MQATRNLAHFTVLAAWAVLGVLFSLKALFGPAASIASVAQAGGWWLWFAALAAVATWMVNRFESALAAFAVHAAIVVGLATLPVFGPFAWVRFGFDALRFA